MEYRASEIKAGIFVAFSIVVFLSFLFAIKGISALQAKDEYYVRFNYVGGIEQGSIVRLAGVPVGRVQSFSMVDESGVAKVQLSLQMKRGTPIRSDSEAFMTTIGIMGSYYIEITAGSNQAKRLPSGSIIRSKDVTGFAQMSGPIGDATVEARESLANLNDLLNEQNRQNVSAMIASLRRMTDENEAAMSSFMQNLNHLSANLNSTVEIFNHFISVHDTTIQKSLQHTQELILESRNLTLQLQNTVQNFDAMLLENRDTYRQTWDNLHTLSRNLEAFSQSIKEQPWNLLRKNYPPERKLE
ncbi:MCE family protein [candidate division KSB1 bacterium]|nr:MCE family protein [candidate division KSB1 bacterium]